MRSMGCLPALILSLSCSVQAADKPAPPRVAELLQEAKEHRQQRRVEDAIRSSEQAVEVHESIVGADNPDLIQTMTVLAANMTIGGRREDALAIRRQVLRIATNAYGEGHFAVRTAQHGVAVAEAVNAFSKEEYTELQDALGRLSDAYRLLDQECDQEACKRCKELLPYFSDKCGAACDESRFIRAVLGIKLTGPDRNAEVIRLVTRDLKAVRVAFGATHPDYIKEATMLAHAYTELGDQENCDKVCREVIDACRAQGSEHPETTGYLQLLQFFAYFRSGRLDDADRVVSEHIGVCRKTKNLDPMILAKGLETAAFLTSQLHDDERTMRYLEEVVSIQDSVGQRTLELAKLKDVLGRGYWKQDDDEKAKRVLKEAIELFEETGGAKLSEAQQARAALGAVCHETGSFEQAIPFLKEAYLRRKTALGMTAKGTREFRDLLVDSLRKCGRNDEADELLREPRPFVVPAAAP